ncbi:MAG: carbonic anhydrase [Elusimicrobiota bacterium]
MIPPDEALERLRQGNRRFAAGTSERIASSYPALRDALAAGQKPFAIVLGCSDSRVPAEIVFDQGLGDLFVVRVAGNVVAPSQIGSVEFAAEMFDARLVVVLGHSSCGAVVATLEELERPSDKRSPGLRSIVDRVRPAVEPLWRPGAGKDPALLAEAVRANVRTAAQHLRRGSDILAERIREGRLRVVGAEYSLRTGIVDFFDGAE